MSEKEIKPVAWTIDEQLEKVNLGRIGFIANRDMITPAADIPLYDQSAIDRLTAERDDWRRQAWHESDVAEVASQEIERLKAERDAAVADADRWKFARDNAPVIESAGGFFRVRGLLSWHPNKDMAIDAAMKEQEQGK